MGHIPLKYRVSFIVVFVDEYTGENAADEISKELQKHKIHKEDVINIETNLAQPGASLPFFRIIVWYKRRSL